MGGSDDLVFSQSFMITLFGETEKVREAAQWALANITHVQIEHLYVDDGVPARLEIVFYRLEDAAKFKLFFG